MNLIEHLHQVRDFRTQPVYPLWVILLLVLMGTMSGYTGYRPLAEFVERHQAELLEYLQIKHPRLPSLSTLRRVMVHIDFRSLTEVFNQWAADKFAPSMLEQIASDGKSIKASLRDYDKSYQDFVAIVSAYSVEQGVVVGLEAMHNGKSSEIATVQHLLETLELTGVCFSFDALHAQKKQCGRLWPMATTT